MSTVTIDKHGYGTVWSMEPSSKKLATHMRRIFRGAYWLYRSMYVDHRYIAQCARVLQDKGVRLARAEDGAAIWLNDAGVFVLATYKAAA